jgi:hypothetical protein
MSRAVCLNLIYDPDCTEAVLNGDNVLPQLTGVEIMNHKTRCLLDSA